MLWVSEAFDSHDAIEDVAYIIELLVILVRECPYEYFSDEFCVDVGGWFVVKVRDYVFDTCGGGFD